MWKDRLSAPSPLVVGMVTEEEIDVFADEPPMEQARREFRSERLPGNTAAITPLKGTGSAVLTIRKSVQPRHSDIAPPPRVSTQLAMTPMRARFKSDGASPAAAAAAATSQRQPSVSPTANGAKAPSEADTALEEFDSTHAMKVVRRHRSRQSVTSTSPRANRVSMTWQTLLPTVTRTCVSADGRVLDLPTPMLTRANVPVLAECIANWPGRLEVKKLVLRTPLLTDLGRTLAQLPVLDELEMIGPAAVDAATSPTAAPQHTAYSPDVTRAAIDFLRIVAARPGLRRLVFQGYKNLLIPELMTNVGVGLADVIVAHRDTLEAIDIRENALSAAAFEAIVTVITAVPITAPLCGVLLDGNASVKDRVRGYASFFGRWITSVRGDHGGKTLQLCQVPCALEPALGVVWLCSQLKQLELHQCNMKYLLKALAQALASNDTLDLLDLRDNNLSDTDVEKLGAALRSNKTLRILMLDGNRVSDATLATFKMNIMADFHASIESVDIASPQLTYFLAHHRNFLDPEVDLSESKLSDELVPQVCDLIQAAPRIASLDLRGNHGLSVQGATIILAKLATRVTDDAKPVVDLADTGITATDREQVRNIQDTMGKSFQAIHFDDAVLAVTPVLTKRSAKPRAAQRKFGGQSLFHVVMAAAAAAGESATLTSPTGDGKKDQMFSPGIEVHQWVSRDVLPNVGGVLLSDFGVSMMIFSEQFARPMPKPARAGGRLIPQLKHSRSSASLTTDQDGRATLAALRAARLGTLTITIATLTSAGLAACPRIPDKFRVCGPSVEVVTNKGLLSFDGVKPAPVDLFMRHSLWLGRSAGAVPSSCVTWADDDAVAAAVQPESTGLRVLYFEGYPCQSDAKWEVTDTTQLQIHDEFVKCPIDKCGFYIVVWDTAFGTPEAKVLLSAFTPAHGWCAVDGPAPHALGVMVDSYLPDVFDARLKQLHSMVTQACTTPLTFSSGLYRRVPMAGALAVSHTHLPTPLLFSAPLENLTVAVQTTSVVVRGEPPSMQSDTWSIVRFPAGMPTLAPASAAPPEAPPQSPRTSRQLGSRAGRRPPPVELAANILMPAAITVRVCQLTSHLTIMSRAPEMPVSFKCVFRTRHTTVLRISNWSSYLFADQQWLVLYVKRLNSSLYSASATPEDSKPIPLPFPPPDTIQGYRKTHSLLLRTGELVVRNEFYACKFRVAAQSRYGISSLSPAVVIHPSLKVANDTFASLALQRRLQECEDHNPNLELEQMLKGVVPLSLLVHEWASESKQPSSTTRSRLTSQLSSSESVVVNTRKVAALQAQLAQKPVKADAVTHFPSPPSPTQDPLRAAKRWNALRNLITAKTRLMKATKPSSDAAAGAPHPPAATAEAFTNVGISGSSAATESPAAATVSRGSGYWAKLRHSLFGNAEGRQELLQRLKSSEVAPRDQMALKFNSANAFGVAGNELHQIQEESEGEDGDSLPRSPLGGSGELRMFGSGKLNLTQQASPVKMPVSDRAQRAERSVSPMNLPAGGGDTLAGAVVVHSFKPAPPTEPAPRLTLAPLVMFPMTVVGLPIGETPSSMNVAMLAHTLRSLFPSEAQFRTLFNCDYRSAYRSFTERYPTPDWLPEHTAPAPGMAMLSVLREELKKQCGLALLHQSSVQQLNRLIQDTLTACESGMWTHYTKITDVLMQLIPVLMRVLTAVSVLHQPGWLSYLNPHQSTMFTQQLVQLDSAFVSTIQPLGDIMPKFRAQLQNLHMMRKYHNECEIRIATAAYLQMIWQADTSLSRGVPFELVAELCRQLKVAHTVFILEEIRVARNRNRPAP